MCGSFFKINLTFKYSILYNLFYRGILQGVGDIELHQLNIEQTGL